VAAKKPTIARADPALTELAAPVKVGTVETVDDGGDLGVAVADSAAAFELPLPATDVGAPDPEE